MSQLDNQLEVAQEGKGNRRHFSTALNVPRARMLVESPSQVLAKSPVEPHTLRPLQLRSRFLSPRDAALRPFCEAELPGSW